MLAYEEAGAGPPIVLLHGMGTGRYRWRPIIELLQADFRCIAVDLPGHGDSPDEGLDSFSATLAVHQLCEHLGLEDPLIVGHSLGATVALMHAALSPTWPIISIDPAPLYLPHFTDRLAPFAERLQGADFQAAFREWEATLLEGAPSAPETGLWEQLRPRQAVVLSYWRNLFSRDDAVALQSGWEEMLASIAVPALILLADEPSPEDSAILRRMPTTVVEISAGLGHALHLADPARFAQRLREFHAASQSGRRV